jgi:hypothetical protein
MSMGPDIKQRDYWKERHSVGAAVSGDYDVLSQCKISWVEI